MSSLGSLVPERHCYVFWLIQMQIKMILNKNKKCKKKKRKRKIKQRKRKIKDKKFTLRDHQQKYQITFITLNNNGFCLLNIYPPRPPLTPRNGKYDMKLEWIHRAVGRSAKSIRKKPAKWIEKNLKNIIWYSSYESSKTGKCNTFLVSFIIPLSCP